jgi:two-component system osmolarity sensor histidine kinase EnvZ
VALGPGGGLAHRLRRLLPRSLLGRLLLILLVPMLLLQAIALATFYGNHLDVVSRRLSGAIAGEVAFVLGEARRMPPGPEREEFLRRARERMGLEISIEHGARLPETDWRNVIGPLDDDLAAALRERTRLPVFLDWSFDERHILVKIQLPDGVARILTPRKRLYTNILYLFLVWTVTSAAVLFTIAALFMRNQVRALRRLAGAAEAFGMGRDVGPITPEGAAEVRQAAAAFNRMQDRVRRYLSQRTEMLAGVSHDLRTPLTRLRLAIAMLPQNEATRQDIADMTADVAEMERMIESYLAFARGEGAEAVEPTDLSVMLEEVAARARRSGAAVEITVPEHLTLPLRADAVRRAITNLVDNAARHAKRVVLAASRPNERNVLVTIDDDGPGIPASAREDVFRPFASGPNGGTGLGLTIARDIVRAHGGDILLEDSPLGGLRARVRLPA